MNDQNPNSSENAPKPPALPLGIGAVPPPIPAYSRVAQPLGANPAEKLPITGLVSAIEAILRQPRRVMFQLKQPNPGSVIASLLIITIVCSVVYGLIAGTFSGGDQYWAAPLKISAGLLISALICLPSLYIFSCLGGSQGRLVEVFGLMSGLLALMTLLLLGFAPVAWVFSQSTKSVAVMGGLLLAFWFVATLFGLRFLNSGFAHLSGKSGSDMGIKVWVVIFLLVALQMTTALRPIVGTSTRFLPLPAEKKFFLGHWLDNMDKDTKGNRENHPDSGYLPPS
ncbi:MAG: ABC-type transport system, permease component [Pedosphaera sp.]|nr:ABC-type transport system, permease component [Pedosphaera sp.]